MADFEVSIDKLNSAAENFDRIQSALRRISSDADSTIRTTRWDIISRITAALSRSTICANINNCASDMANLASGLRDAVRVYLAYESNVKDKTFGKAVPIKNKKSSSKEEEPWLNKLIKNFGNIVIETAENIKSKGKQALDWFEKQGEKVVNKCKNTWERLKEIYNSHGLLYDIVEYAKATAKVVGGVAMVTTGIVSLFFTGGASTPLAVTTMIYGLNEITNGFVDGINVGRDNYDDVGHVNFLKDSLTGLGGYVGEKLGNEKAGEAIGKIVYYAGDLYIAFGNLSNKVDKTKQVEKVKGTDAWNGLIGAANTPITKDMLYSDIGYTKWIINQNGGEAVSKLWKTVSPYVSAGYGAAEFTTEVLSDLQDIQNTATGSEYSNEFLEKYDFYTSDNPVSQAKGVIKSKDKIKDMYDTYKNLYGTFKLKGA